MKIKNIAFFVKNEIGLNELMTLLGFRRVNVDDPFVEHCKYLRAQEATEETIAFAHGLFDEKDNLKDIRNLKAVEEMVCYEEHPTSTFVLYDDPQLPF